MHERQQKISDTAGQLAWYECVYQIDQAADMAGVGVSAAGG